MFFGLSVVLALLNMSQALGSVFEYPRDANYVVIEYSQSHDMILDADPIPMLRIYGDGRVQVHYPAYMKRAGDYEMRLPDAALQQLLNSLEQKGILTFNSNKILQLKKQSVSKLLAENENKVLSVRSDDSHSKIQIKLTTYQPVNSSQSQTSFSKKISWKNLRSDAQSHPNVVELQNAAEAEQELGQYLTHRDLVKIK